MATNELVNNIAHQHLKVITERSAQYGDNVWYTATFPDEFRSIQGYYPIFFTKDPDTGKFFSAALFGFEQGDNLFLTDNHWDAGYIPLTIQRQPFSIGQQTINDGGTSVEQRVLHIDIDNPRVNTDHGQALFLEYGGNSEYLERMADMLEIIHHGLLDNDTFIEQLISLALLEPFTLDVQLNNGTQHQMIGFYTINEDNLYDLPAETIATLHQQGYLAAIYMTIASQSCIRDLMNRKNSKLGI